MRYVYVKNRNPLIFMFDLVSVPVLVKRKHQVIAESSESEFSWEGDIFCFLGRFFKFF